MKIQSLKKILMIAVLTTGFVINKTTFASEQKFKLQRNKSLKLCQELNQIFKEPENEKLFKVTDMSIYSPEYIAEYGAFIPKYEFTSARFAIPKKYKNFSLPAWKDLTEEELTQYLSPDALNKLSKSSLPRDIKVAKIDLNHDGVRESVLNFKRQDSNYSYCFVGDVESEDISKDFSKFAQFDCFFFYYEGMPYRSSLSGSYDFFIDTPKSSPSYGFALLETCTFEAK